MEMFVLNVPTYAFVSVSHRWFLSSPSAQPRLQGHELWIYPTTSRLDKGVGVSHAVLNIARTLRWYFLLFSLVLVPAYPLRFGPRPRPHGSPLTLFAMDLLSLPLCYGERTAHHYRVLDGIEPQRQEVLLDVGLAGFESTTIQHLLSPRTQDDVVLKRHVRSVALPARG